MEKEYYIVEGDNRVGPLSIRQLSERGLEPSTPVWTPGMADWTRADRVPELAHLIAGKAPSEPYQQPYQQPKPQQQYGGFNGYQSNQGGYSNPSTNWKTLAIVATVVGFLFSCIGGIVGIFAITNANKAENATRYGDQYTAQSAWSTCKTLCIVSFVLSGIGLIGNFFYIFKILPQLGAL